MTMKYKILLFMFASSLIANEYRFELKKADDKVKSNNGQIHISSKTGIGQLTVSKLKGQWPKELKILLKGFKRLEGFTLWTANKVVKLNYKQTLTAEGIIVSFSSDQLKHFKTFKIQWVDMYRN